MMIDDIAIFNNTHLLFFDFNAFSFLLKVPTNVAYLNH